MERADYLPPERLRELATAIDPAIRLEPDAEQVLQDVADDFVENVRRPAPTRPARPRRRIWHNSAGRSRPDASRLAQVAAFACQLASHRGSRTLETQDVQLALEKLCGPPR